MKLYLRSFLSAFGMGLFGAIPLVCILIFQTLPQFKTVAFKYKKENTSVAVESVYEIMNHFHDKELKKQLTKVQAQTEALILIKKLRYAGKEYFWINDLSPTMIMHPFKPELDGKDVSKMADPTGKKLFIEMVAAVKGEEHQGFVDYEWAKPNSDKPVPKISFVKLFEPWGWIIGSGVYVDNVLREVKSIQTTNLEYLSFGLLFLLLMSCYTGYRQIKKWVMPVQKALGALTVETEKLYSSAGQIQVASKELSDQVSTQASAIEETVTSMEEMSAMLGKSATQSQNNLSSTSEGESKGLNTQQNFKKLHGAMDQIEQSNNNLDTIKKLMDSISEKTKIINNIVFETRLLSFNASIEAARAGVHGKGFSVVSEEIGKLAKVSGSAAEEIRILLESSQKEVSLVIKDIQEKVKDGEKISNICADDVNEIVGILQKINTASQEITSANREQEVGIKQTNLAMNQMEQVTQSNSQNSDALAKLSQDLVTRAAAIRTAIQSLGKVVDINEHTSENEASEGPSKRDKLELVTDQNKNLDQAS